MANTCEILVPSDGGDISVPPLGGVRSALAHSNICFETVMRLYYLRHGYEVPDGHMSHNLVCLAYKALLTRSSSTTAAASHTTMATSQEEARSTLILAAKGLNDQGKHYYLPIALLQIILAEICSEDRTAVQQYITTWSEDDASRQLRERYVSSQYPVGLNKTSAQRRLDYLTKGYLKLAREQAQFSSRDS
jgi:hypothetical protein